MRFPFVFRFGFVSSLFLLTALYAPCLAFQQDRDSGSIKTTETVATAGSQSTENAETVVVNSDLVSLRLTVTDKNGHCVLGLQESDFAIFEEKTPQVISFFGEDDSPVSVGIVFDLTGSMSQEKLRRAREAIVNFMKTSHREDEYSLVTMKDGKASLVLSRTIDQQAVIDEVSQGEGSGNTALYDACYLAVNTVSKGERPRRALLVISDGQDNKSRYTLAELRDQLKESDVIVYSIDVAERDDDPANLYGREVLTDISEITGGEFFQPQTEDQFNDAFDRIALALRHQYAIGYKPAEVTPEPKWRRIKVKVQRPPGSSRIFLRYRSGYYAKSKVISR
jgi:Ca-activated chloride channel family protein